MNVKQRNCNAALISFSDIALEYGGKMRTLKCVIKYIMFSENVQKHIMYSVASLSQVCTVKRPKFGNGPLVRQPLFEVLKNHISAWSEVSDQVQRGERLYIFF